MLCLFFSKAVYAQHVSIHFMNCLVCNHDDTKVIDSRVGSDGYSIRRRRECGKCGFRFSTVEESDILDLLVIKRNGEHEPYNREKIEVGLRRSLEKRPYTRDQLRSLVQKIERDIQRRRKVEITSKEIGEIVMKHLRHFDQVGYIRFASVYRSFQDIEGFAEELKGLKHKGKRTHYVKNKGPSG